MRAMNSGGTRAKLAGKPAHVSAHHVFPIHKNNVRVLPDERRKAHEYIIHLSMKTSLLLVSLLATASFAFAGTDSSSCGGCCAATAMATMAATNDATSTYPLDTCVVSGEKLGGEMGAPIDYIYKEAGKPDRLVRFCCKMCIPKFKKDPAKYLKLIDEAAASKKKA